MMDSLIIMTEGIKPTNVFVNIEMNLGSILMHGTDIKRGFKLTLVCHYLISSQLSDMQSKNILPLTRLQQWRLWSTSSLQCLPLRFSTYYADQKCVHFKLTTADLTDSQVADNEVATIKVEILQSSVQSSTEFVKRSSTVLFCFLL